MGMCVFMAGSADRSDASFVWCCSLEDIFVVCFVCYRDA